MNITKVPHEVQPTCGCCQPARGHVFGPDLLCVRKCGRHWADQRDTPQECPNLHTTKTMGDVTGAHPRCPRGAPHGAPTVEESSNDPLDTQAS